MFCYWLQLGNKWVDIAKLMGRMDTWVKTNWRKILKYEGIPINDHLKDNIKMLVEKLKANILEEKIIEGIDMSNSNNCPNFECGEVFRDPSKSGGSNEESKLVISIESIPEISGAKEGNLLKKSWSEISDFNMMNAEEHEQAMNEMTEQASRILDTNAQDFDFAYDVDERNDYDIMDFEL